MSCCLIQHMGHHRLWVTWISFHVVNKFLNIKKHHKEHYLQHWIGWIRLFQANLVFFQTSINIGISWESCLKTDSESVSWNVLEILHSWKASEWCKFSCSLSYPEYQDFKAKWVRKSIYFSFRRQDTLPKFVLSNPLKK